MRTTAPLPGKICASTVSMSPPTDVQTRPLTTPTRGFSRARAIVYVAGPRYLLRSSGLTTVFSPKRPPFLSAASTTLRKILPMKRSSPRTPASRVQKRMMREIDLFGLEARGAELLRNQMMLGDVKLLLLGVARKRDHLHAVKKRRRNVVAVGSGHEHHVGEIHRNLHVVVGERIVLLRIEHLKHGRRRIAAPIRTHLVDFIEQEERIAHARADHALDDLAGHRSHVGAAMPADFTFIAHAAQGHAHELASRRTSDGLAERSLADAGRPHEAENRRLHLAHALLNGEILKDPLLHLFKAGMILVKNAGRRVKVARDAGLLRPRIVRERLDVVAHHDGLGAHRRHLAQAAKLVAGGLVGILGHLRIGDALFKVGVFVLGAVAGVAELLADGLHLLVEVVIALVLLHLALDAAIDAGLKLQHITLVEQMLNCELKTLHEVGFFKDAHLFGRLAGRLTANKVDQALGVALRLKARILVVLAAHLGKILPFADQAASLRLNRASIGDDGLKARRAGHKHAVALLKRIELIAHKPLHEHLGSAVGEREELHDGRKRPDLIAVLLLGTVHIRVFLRDDENVFGFGVIGLARGVNRHRASHEDRGERRGEDHHVSHGNGRHFDVFGVLGNPVDLVIQICSPNE